MLLWNVVMRVRRPLFLAVAILCALGIRAAATAPEGIFPPISLSRVEVFAHAGDLPPEAMRAQVTRPLEAALQSLPAVREMRSYSTLGAVEIELDFDPSTDPRNDRQNVDTALAGVRSQIGVLSSLETVIEHPNMEPVVSYGVLSPSISQARLRHLIESRITATFLGTSELERVTIAGGPPLEETAVLRPAAIARAGVTAQQVAEAIGAANAAVAAAPIDTAGERSILAVGNVLTPAALPNLKIPTPHGAVPLRTLARVGLTDGPATQQASVDGTHAVIVNVYSVPNGDAVTLARDVANRMGGLIATLPRGTRAVKYWDQTALIAQTIRALQLEMLAGAVLALAVVFIFLRSWGLTLVAAITVPVAVFVTILAIVSSGMTLNLMSLGGLAIAIGLIVDETIVVAEAVAREWSLDPSAPRFQTIVRALRRIAAPLVASTLAILVVFVPLALLSGIPGAFFRALALTLGVALIVSIGASLGVAPALAALRTTRGQPAALRQAQGDTLEVRYQSLLHWTLGHRAIVFASGAVVFVAGALLWTLLPNDFLPELNEGQFEIKYLFPPGINLATTDRLATTMERAILSDSAAAHVGRLTGVDTNGYVPTPLHGGTLRVMLKANAPAFALVANRLRVALNRATPTATLEFHQLLEDQLNDLSGAPEPIQISIAGPDDRQLDAIAKSVAARIASVAGVEDPVAGVFGVDAIVGLAPRTSSGTSATALAAKLTAQLPGIVATNIDDADGPIPVRVRLPITRVDAIASLPVATAGGSRTLATLATIAAPFHASDVYERNGVPTVLVTADLEGAPLSTVIPKIRAATAAVRLPPGYRLAIGGEYAQQRAAFAEFANVFAVALALVVLVLVAAFASFRLPIVVLATVPLAPLGASLALLATGTPVNIASFMGALLLIGIVVRNGILLVDAANRRRASGAGVRDALLGAGAERLRPILMTAFATVGGLAPLAIGFGAGSEMERPLAITVIGGLAFATACSLIVVPALYATLARQSETIRDSTFARSAASEG